MIEDKQIKEFSYQMMDALRHYVPKEFLGMTDQYWDEFDEYFKNKKDNKEQTIF